VTEAPDYDKTAKVPSPVGGSHLPELNQLQTDTALLRRIAHNTDIIRIVLIWTLVVVPIALVAIAIILGISATSSAPTPASDTGTAVCELVPANC
jgi:hypothetical protein